MTTFIGLDIEKEEVLGSMCEQILAELDGTNGLPVEADSSPLHEAEAFPGMAELEAKEGN